MFCEQNIGRAARRRPYNAAVRCLKLGDELGFCAVMVGIGQGIIAAVDK